ncbi:MAG: YdcF family protein [Betaproteobacteria bacterium]|nr:YdcF family protein [Betaproteobacteria bacterium]
MSVFLTALLASLLLPPLCFILPALGGLALMRRHRAAGALLVLAAVTALAAASTPFVADRLLAALETPPLPAPPARAPETTPGASATRAAIVVLGGGLGRESPEYGTDTVNPPTLERLRYAAWLHRRTGLPILVSGGRPLDTRLSEADTMRDALTADFNAPPRWVEGDSLNTRENAVRAQALLADGSIRRIYLVTHAWHMPRARRAFEEVGLEVIAAPTGYASITPSPMAWVPSGQALRNTHLAMREWLGQAWYRLNSAVRG